MNNQTRIIMNGWDAQQKYHGTKFYQTKQEELVRSHIYHYITGKYDLMEKDVMLWFM